MNSVAASSIYVCREVCLSAVGSDRLSVWWIPVEADATVAVSTAVTVLICIVSADGRCTVALIAGVLRVESAAMVMDMLSHRHVEEMYSESAMIRRSVDMVAVDMVSDVVVAAEDVRHDCA